MRHIKHFLSFLLVTLVLINIGIKTFAKSKGFSTDDVSAEESEAFLENIEITFLTIEPKKKAIQCFDVNQSGSIAVGCGAKENKTVCVYNENGDFQYGYKFSCYGSIGVELNENYLNVYFVRSSTALSLDFAGEVISVTKISKTIENNEYWNDFVFSTKRNVGETEYLIKNDMAFLNVFTSSYSQLVVKDLNGEHIIYDVNSMQLLKMIIIVVFALILIITASIVIAREFKKARRK